MNDKDDSLFVEQKTVCHFHFHHLKDFQGRWVITTHRNDIDCARPESVVYKVVKDER